MFFKESEIDLLIEEDLPYIDLTTESLGIAGHKGEIVFCTRTEGVVCCTEEAARILGKIGASVTFALPSGTKAPSGTEILKARGTAAELHKGWKICQNLLEYAGGIATYTEKMCEKASGLPIFTTRKSQPGFKKISMKAVISGGGYPHRLGLSETFLLFDNHRTFLEQNELLKRIEELKNGALLEKTIAVETDSLEDARCFAMRGVRLFQLEKFRPDALREAVRILKKEYPDIRLLATGGIRLENVADYASTGVDGIITTAPYYYAEPTDIRVSISRR